MGRKTNPDEMYVVDLANGIPGVSARLSTEAEDCGYQKSDVVLGYEGQIFHLQVSNTPKSSGAHKRLTRRGTHPIHTHSFPGFPVSDQNLVDEILKIIEKG